MILKRVALYLLPVLLGSAAVHASSDRWEQAAKVVKEYESSRSYVTCPQCHVLVGGLQGLIATGSTLEELEHLAIGVCKTYHLFTDDVCEQMVYLSAPEVIYVLNTTTYDVDTVCNSLLDVCPTSLPPWTIDVPPNKPEPSHPDALEGPSTYHILHLSDSHYDPLYEEGTPTICTHPLCCRAWGDPNDTYTSLAGMWGAEHGNCDAPQRTLEAALQAATLLQPDIIYVTGDLPPHDVWNQSKASIIESTTFTAALIRQYFPGTPISYSLGNHEAAPVNSYAVPEVYADGWTMDWLYEALVPVWEDGGAPAEVMDTVLQGGYYHWSPTPGLRVVSLNVNYGHFGNWFLILGDEDPTGQLAWLNNVLLASEVAGEKVHILAHIAPGNLLESFSHSYNKVISRFESTITGIFSGHSHDDQYKLIWDVEDNTRPVAVTYVAGSINSDGKKSPSIRMYQVDGGYEGATWAVRDHLTYSMNLTLANAGADPVFPLAYSAKASYGLQSLSPENWAAVTWNMATDEQLFNEYLRHYYSFWAEPSQLATCDLNCRKSTLCGISSGDATDGEPCQRIKDQVDSVTDTTPAPVH